MGLYETSRTLLERLGLGKAREMTNTIQALFSHRDVTDRMFGEAFKEVIDGQHNGEAFSRHNVSNNEVSRAMREAYLEVSQTASFRRAFPYA